jgi:hypothetical protein
MRRSQPVCKSPNIGKSTHIAKAMLAREARYIHNFSQIARQRVELLIKMLEEQSQFLRK